MLDSVDSGALGGGCQSAVYSLEGGSLRSAPNFIVDAVVFVGAVHNVLKVFGELLGWWGGIGVDFHNVIVGFGWACAGHDKVVDSLEVVIRGENGCRARKLEIYEVEKLITGMTERESGLRVR